MPIANRALSSIFEGLGMFAKSAIPIAIGIGFTHLISIFKKGIRDNAALSWQLKKKK